MPVILALALGVQGSVQAETAFESTTAGSKHEPFLADSLDAEFLERKHRVLSAYYADPVAVPIWLRPRDGMLRIKQLIEAIDTAAAHGLPVARYPTKQFEAAARFGWRKPADPKAALGLDRAITDIYMRFARDLIAGAVDPETLNARVHLDPVRVNPRMLLDAAVDAGDIRKLLLAMTNDSPRYLRLKSAIAAMQDQRARGGWGPTVRASALSPGQSAPAVAALRRRLVAMGDLLVEPDFAGRAAEVGPENSAYDDRLKEAVMRFQTRHGLEVDGIAGAKTLAAINRPLEARLAQAMLNMERLRWHREALDGRRIEVNLPEYRMRVFGKAGTVLHEARVIIGQQERRLQTPQFSDHLSYLVLNPTWTVPKSIIQREMLPELKKNANWLAQNNMILLKNGKKVDPSKVDWAQQTQESVSVYSVVQKSGEDNALGAVKFMFPNQYNIYLHDTPNKALFGEDDRTFSHGCVRVERPFALAWTLLGEQNDDPGALIDEALASGKEKSVPLDEPVPIRMVYFTAWVDEAGMLHFRDDIYERDTALARALNEIAATAGPASAQRQSGL